MRKSVISQSTPSGVIRSTILEDEKNQVALQKFKNLIKSCYGPNASLKTIQHHSGGNLTLTSCSFNLLKNLPIKKPFLRLLVTAVLEHLRLFGDGGLFVGFMVTELVSRSCSYYLPRALCCDVNSILLGWCNDFMSEKCRIQVDLCNMKHLMAVVRSVISTKPACCFTGTDILHVSSLIIQAFLKTFSVTDYHNDQFIQYVLVAGYDPEDSQVIDGVLFQLPKDNPENDLPSRLKLITHPLKVALYNISLAGDTDVFPDVQYEVSDKPSTVEVVKDRLFEIAHKLIDDGVNILACQKVVHPSIKKFLIKNGVAVVDRLSIVNIDAVSLLTGAKCISSLHCNTTMDNMYGSLTKLKIVDYYKKSYYHFVNDSKPVCTVILCSRLETTLNEFMSVCKSALAVLGSLMSNPIALPGAGCFEILLADHLKQRVKSTDNTLCSGIGASLFQFKSAADNFIKSLQEIAISNLNGYPVTNISQSHLWIIPDESKLDSDWIIEKPCNCGLCHFENMEDIIYIKNEHTGAFKIKDGDKNKCTNSISATLNENAIFDTYNVKMNALNIAVETANLILKIHQTISMN